MLASTPAAAAAAAAAAHAQHLDAAASLLKSASRVAVFTGAGMSADSGISTFRGSSGSIWAGLSGALLLALYGTPFGWWVTPSLAWKKYLSVFREPMVQAQPHAGHLALARLEQERFFGDAPLPLISMNVDGLHQRAGSRK
jgi:NAD-dependent deacetylase